MEEVAEQTQISFEDVIPDDCLADVFRFLQLRELIRIERVCKRWRAVSQRCWSKRKVLDFKYLRCNIPDESNFFCAGNVYQLLSKCGNHLNRLRVFLRPGDEITTTEVLQLIGDHCANLYYLKLDLIWDGPEIIPESFLHSLSKLKTLSITGNVEAAHLKTFLKAAGNLAAFYMYDDSDGRKKFLKYLTPDCRYLRIYNSNTRYESEYDLAKVLPKLSKLESFKSNCVSEPTLLRLPVSCKDLELLGCDLSCDSPELELNEVLQRLKNLKFLDVLLYDGVIMHPSALEPASQTLEILHLTNRPSLVETKAWPFLLNLRVLIYRDYDRYYDRYCDACTAHNKDPSALLFSRCPNLEELDFSGTGLGIDGIRQVAKLRKLRKLKINHCQDMDSECVQFLSENMNETLEFLECKNTRFNDEQLLRVLRRCDKLTHLRADLPNEEFMNQASEIVRGRAEKNLTASLLIFKGWELKHDIEITVCQG